MKHILSIIIFSVLIVSCKEKEKPIIPSDIIQKENMVNILVDVQLVEATFSSKTIATHQSLPDYYQFVFNKHKITKEEYEKAMSYYKDNPILFDEIYEAVLEKLIKLEAEEKGIKQEQKPKKSDPSKKPSLLEQMHEKVKQDSIVRAVEASDSKISEQKLQK